MERRWTLWTYNGYPIVDDFLLSFCDNNEKRFIDLKNIRILHVNKLSRQKHKPMPRVVVFTKYCYINVDCQDCSNPIQCFLYLTILSPSIEMNKI